MKFSIKNVHLDSPPSKNWETKKHCEQSSPNRIAKSPNQKKDIEKRDAQQAATKSTQTNENGVLLSITKLPKGICLKKSFKCTLCEKSYVSEPMLKAHMRSDHMKAATKKTSANLHLCDLCEHAFLSHDELRLHVSKIHGSEKAAAASSSVRIKFGDIKQLKDNIKMHRMQKSPQPHAQHFDLKEAVIRMRRIDDEEREPNDAESAGATTKSLEHESIIEIDLGEFVFRIFRIIVQF